MSGFLFSATGVLGLMFVGLSLNTIRIRIQHQQSLGDGAHPALIRAIRAHANFAEYVPIALLLMWISSAHQNNLCLNHWLAGALIIFRLSHAYSILWDEPAKQRAWPYFRSFGMVGTLTIIIILCVQLIGLGATN